MNSSKLKLLLIVLFLAADIFFLHRIISIRNAKNTFTEAEITNAIKLVSSKGVNVSSDKIPKEKNPPKTLKLDWDVSSIELAVKQIIHSEYGSFKIPNGHTFTNDEEAMSVFYDYSFEYAYLNSNETLDYVKKALEGAKADDSKAIKKYEKTLKNLTKNINSKDFEITAKIDGCVKIGSKDYVAVSQYINDCKVDGAEFVAVFENERVIFAAGKFYFSNKVNKYSTSTHDSINILFELEESENEIIEIQRQYFPVRENDDSVYLTPSYKFTYDDNTSTVYDATSGIKRK